MATTRQLHISGMVYTTDADPEASLLFVLRGHSDGQIMTGRFSDYRLPQFSDVPVLETVLLDRQDLPSAGAGEGSLVGVAPAIANAIFDATGVRLRLLPPVPNGFKVS